jgi:transcriptional regulator with XRE-family HTH domain
LNRLREVRQQQSLSLRTVARRLEISVQDAELQESETADLSLSQIYRWQQALDVPVSELLEDSELQLSAAIKARASLVRVMKTAVTLMEAAPTARVKRLAKMLIDQLVQTMPELENVAAWQSSGSQRGLNDLGRAAEYQLEDSFFRT